MSDFFNPNSLILGKFFKRKMLHVNFLDQDQGYYLRYEENKAIMYLGMSCFPNDIIAIDENIDLANSMLSKFHNTIVVYFKKHNQKVNLDRSYSNYIVLLWDYKNIIKNTGEHKSYFLQLFRKFKRNFELCITKALGYYVNRKVLREAFTLKENISLCCFCKRANLSLGINEYNVIEEAHSKMIKTIQSVTVKCFARDYYFENWNTNGNGWNNSLDEKRIIYEKPTICAIFDGYNRPPHKSMLFDNAI